MDYTIELLEDIRHRYISLSTLYAKNSSLSMPDIRTLLDTGAFNTMIDSSLAKRFGVMLPIIIPISIGGTLGEAQGCIIHRISLGNFEMTQTFALAFPFKDWLTGHIILGANVLNNWNFTTSRTNNTIKFVESIPNDVPNKKYPYQNYFAKGKYVALQDDLLNNLT